MPINGLSSSYSINSNFAVGAFDGGAARRIDDRGSAGPTDGIDRSGGSALDGLLGRGGSEPQIIARGGALRELAKELLKQIIFDEASDRVRDGLKGNSSPKGPSDQPTGGANGNNGAGGAGGNGGPAQTQPTTSGGPSSGGTTTPDEVYTD